MENIEALFSDHVVTEEQLWLAVSETPIAEDLLDLLFAHPRLSDRIMHCYFIGELVDDDTIGDRWTEDFTLGDDIYRALTLPDLSDQTRVAIMGRLGSHALDGCEQLEEFGVIFEGGSCVLDICYESLAGEPPSSLFDFNEMSTDFVAGLTKFRNSMSELIKTVAMTKVGDEEHLEHWVGIYPECTFMNEWIAAVDGCLTRATSPED